MIVKLNKYGKEINIKPLLEMYSSTDFMGIKKMNLCVQLYSTEDLEYFEPWSNLTVNFGEFIGMSNSAYIDTNNNGDDILDWMVNNEFGNKTGFKKRSGFCEYPLFAFTPEFLKEIDEKNLYESYIAQYNFFGDEEDDEQE